jgi:hypothetical protein
MSRAYIGQNRKVAVTLSLAESPQKGRYQHGPARRGFRSSMVEQIQGHGRKVDARRPQRRYRRYCRLWGGALTVTGMAFDNLTGRGLSPSGADIRTLEFSRALE